MRPKSLQHTLTFAALMLCGTANSQTAITPSDLPQKLIHGNSYTFVDADNFYVNSSFFSHDTGGTYTFNAIDGTYLVQADHDHEYLQIRPCDETGKPVTLQDDGTGTVYVIGENVGFPTATGNPVGWNTDRALAMAPVGSKKYELTFIVGKEIGTTCGFKFYGQTDWGKEFYVTSSESHPYRLTSVSDVMGLGTAQKGESDVSDGYPYFKSDANVTIGDTVVLSLDFSDGDALGTFDAKLSKSQTAFNPRMNGIPFKPDETYGYSLITTIGTGLKCVFSGTDAFKDNAWYMDPDFFKPDGSGNYTFIPIHGLYEFIADFNLKYIKVFPVSKQEDGSCQVITYNKETGKGSVWAIGNKGLGKPSFAANGHDWWSDVLYALPLAEIKDKVYQLTLTAGEQIQGDNISFALYGQPGWDIQFGENPLMVLQENARNFISTDARGNISGTQGAKLENGQTIVFLLDCTNPQEVKLSYTTGSTTGIQDIPGFRGKGRNVYYNLQGMKMAQPAGHGVFIRDGKKIIK